MTERFAGRYEFVDILGDGGMGTVWRVWDHKERAFRAAKMLKQSDSASLLRFVRETSWRIDHEHVVTPLGWSAEDDRVLFTMPLVAGGTVATLTRDFGALPGIWVGDLIGQLLAGLRAVHAAGLVHRDVKPSNLLLDATGTARPRLRLTDFGIAAPVDDPRMTRVGDVIGTPGYQAPEAARGADPDPRQDLYAVGVVALELLTGRRPPAEHSGADALDPVDLGAAGQSSLAPVIGSLLEVDPRRRPGSADEALTALRERPPTGWDRRRSDEIEVFDQLPALPGGWTPDGPQPPTPMPAPPQQQPVPQQPVPKQPVPQQPAQQLSHQQPVQQPPGPLQPGQQQPTPVEHRAATTPTTLRTSAVARKRPAQVIPLLLIGFGLILIVVAVLLLT